jgi:hypothetical protein
MVSPLEQAKNLSTGAIRRAVLEQSLQHPSFIYPAAMGVIGGIGAFVVAGSPLIVGAAAIAAGAAAIALATNYFVRHDRIAGSYLAEVRRRIAAEREAQIADLAADLKEVKSAEASRQLERFADKMTTFQSVLAEKLSPQELTFARFSAIAEAVFLAAIDNLRAIHLTLKSLQSIDERYIRDRLAALGKGGDGAADAEAKGLKDQLAQAASLRERVKAKLGQNELAMAELDRATAAIGDMHTGAGRPTLDMESAMQELARIAQRSAEY